MRVAETLIAGVQVVALTLLSATAPLAHLHREDSIGFEHAITVHAHLDGLSHRSSQRSEGPSSRSHGHEESVDFSCDVMPPPLVSQPSGLHLALVAPVAELQQPSRSFISNSEDGCRVYRSPPLFRTSARAPPSAR